ncbi:MAG: hypothetical protein JWM21_2255 [Acidobacteria bacterium]|nr:hypothetical protein [Acidobacteriota bacterium]
MSHPVRGPLRVLRRTRSPMSSNEKSRLKKGLVRPLTATLNRTPGTVFTPRRAAANGANKSFLNGPVFPTFGDSRS